MFSRRKAIFLPILLLIIFRTALSNLLCRSCGNTITSAPLLKNVKSNAALYGYNMSILGHNALVQVFKNPVPETFHVITAEAAELKLSSRSYSQNTWFPGTQWTACVCSKCDTHLGWYYESSSDNFVGLVLDYLISSESKALCQRLEMHWFPQIYHFLRGWNAVILKKVEEIKPEKWTKKIKENFCQIGNSYAPPRFFENGKYLQRMNLITGERYVKDLTQISAPDPVRRLRLLVGTAKALSNNKYVDIFRLRLRWINPDLWNDNSINITQRSYDIMCQIEDEKSGKTFTFVDMRLDSTLSGYDENFLIRERLPLLLRCQIRAINSYNLASRWHKSAAMKFDRFYSANRQPPQRHLEPKISTNLPQLSVPKRIPQFH